MKEGMLYLDTNWEISQLFDKNLSQFIVYDQFLDRL